MLITTRKNKMTPTLLARDKYDNMHYWQKALFQEQDCLKKAKQSICPRTS